VVAASAFVVVRRARILVALRVAAHENRNKIRWRGPPRLLAEVRYSMRAVFDGSTEIRRRPGINERARRSPALKHTQLSRSVRRHVVVCARERARAKPRGAKLGVLEVNLDEHVVFGIATEFGD